MTTMDEPRDPAYPEAVVTDVKERHGCLYVSGVVMRGSERLRAEFTVPQGDISRMSRDDFYRWAARRLPQCTEDMNWLAEATA